jgi:hypothetical protein
MLTLSGFKVSIILKNYSNYDSIRLNQGRTHGEVLGPDLPIEISIHSKI